MSESSPSRREPQRQELDPPTSTSIEEEAAPPERPAQKRPEASDVALRLDELIERVGTSPLSYEGRLARDLLTAALKLLTDGRTTGELKLITTAVKELRYAYRVFAEYDAPRVTIFGSARTPEEHPDYQAAVEFGRLMAAAGWMAITGAGAGIMKAGHVGPGREASFGASIRLPAEERANEVIAGDEKLVRFRYFFTRKLIFLSQCDAVALFPGGFGTMDEAFETLTLVQTGKAALLPIVMIEGKGERYWEQWREFIEGRLLARGMINADDLQLFHIARDPADAVSHITGFYRVYHSSRYVGDRLVIRLKHPLAAEDVDRLGSEFADLVASGRLQQRGALSGEDDHLDLPRLVFAHTRRDYGRLRALVDALNRCKPATR
jgi:uncharacterized protein (TIGR00730 family)